MPRTIFLSGPGEKTRDLTPIIRVTGEICKIFYEYKKPKEGGRSHLSWVFLEKVSDKNDFRHIFDCSLKNDPKAIVSSE